MGIKRNVKIENTQQVKIALKLPRTVYGVLAAVTPATFNESTEELSNQVSDY
jgi:hypothetical protein